MGAREGLLRPEFRDWYPKLVPGVWYQASWLTATVLEQQESGEPRWALDERVLSDVHFRFRGGESSQREGRRTRRGPGASAETPQP